MQERLEQVIEGRGLVQDAVLDTDQRHPWCAQARGEDIADRIDGGRHYGAGPAADASAFLK